MKISKRTFLTAGTKVLMAAFVLGGFLLLSGCAGSIEPANDESVSNAPVDEITFLSRYGDWVNVPDYGQVWQPGVSADWRPFTYGHWVWDEDNNDWAWVSYEPYGWLVFHYGNWDYEPGYGWFWIPGSRFQKKGYW